MVARRVLWWFVAGAATLAVGACGGSSQASRAQSRQPHPSLGPALARKLQRTLDQYRAAYGLPGVAAAIVIPGEGRWAGGSGVADHKTGAPVTAETTFAIASVTKAFVGALALKLAQEGRVSLEQPLSRTVPDWPYADRITLRDLLAQTSGVSLFDQTPAFGRALVRDPRACWSPRRVLSHAGSPSSRPGARWQYNNANYLLAGLVLEHATHEPVATTLRREILDPLGLSDVVLQPQERPSPGAAHGYAGLGDLSDHDLSDGTGFLPFRSGACYSWTASGIVASAPSVAKFGDAVIRGTFLGPMARRELTSFRPTGPTGVYTAYALGLGKIGADLWGTVGDAPGFGSTLAYLPAQGITVAVLANQSNSVQATLMIAETLVQRATQDH
jgi:D-alanyl-D-alanine carboxypeptidase